MADSKLLQQMLEHLVNDEQAKAEELFHEYVVQQSREIYESLIDSEIAEETEEDEDEEMDEAAKDDDAEEDKVDESSEEDEEEMDENFDTVAIEGDDEMDLDSEDPTDDLAGDMGPEEGEAEEASEEELFQDLEAIVDELQAKFDELKGMEAGEHEMDGDSGEEEMKDDMDLATVREYVEKVAAPSNQEGADKSAGSLKFSKNDMGGTTANILSGRNGADAGHAGAGSTIKGSALSDTKPTDNPDAKGNINVPGGKAGKTGFTHKEPGHGAEKKGAAEKADNTASLFRGRR